MSMSMKILDGHVDHVLKGLVEVVADLFDLILFVQEIFLHLVNPHIQSLDVHLRLFPSVFAPFQLVHQLQNLILGSLLSGNCLLLPISNCCMFAPTTLSSSSM